jgi:hypothetical protein
MSRASLHQRLSNGQWSGYTPGRQRKDNQQQPKYRVRDMYRKPNQGISCGYGPGAWSTPGPPTRMVQAAVSAAADLLAAEPQHWSDSRTCGSTCPSLLQAHDCELSSSEQPHRASCQPHRCSPPCARAGPWRYATTWQDSSSKVPCLVSPCRATERWALCCRWGCSCPCVLLLTLRSRQLRTRGQHWCAYQITTWGMCCAACPYTGPHTAEQTTSSSQPYGCGSPCSNRSNPTNTKCTPCLWHM